MKYIKDKIPDNWEIVTFREVAELRHGYQFRNYDFTEDGIKIFKITQIKGDGIADISSCSYIDANRVDEFERVLLNRGDILIALTGATIGKVARFNFDEIVLQNYRVGNFFPLSEEILNKEYFYQFLKSKLFYNQIVANQTQSAQQNIGKEDINNMSVVLPTLPEQKAIANILSAIDDKIENNLAINKTLEDMAMALYKHWFVDFEFPVTQETHPELVEGSHKANTNPQKNKKPLGYKSAGGEFIDSELGPIPKGWEVKKLPEISNNYNNKRKPISTRERAKIQGKYPYYGATKILDYINDYKLDGEFILVAEDGTVKTERDTPFLQFVNGQFWVSNHAHVLTGNEIYSNEFLYLSLANTNVIPIITGAVQLKINKKNLQSLEFIVPSEEQLLKFESIIIPKFKKIKELDKENQTLTKLRDTLLPKLISGEVRLKEFKEEIEQNINKVI
jgi:type I restriction enzyme S subunit